jgi:lipopolysaccharide export system permease protein
VIWSLLHRSIFYELTKVFLLAFVALTGLLLLAGVISEATRNGLGPYQILAAIPLLVPSTMPYTLPTTSLFATCVVYGRLAADSEILALRAAGVHMRHVVWPAFLLGAIVSGVTFFLYLDTIPYTHYILRSQIASDVRELLYSMLKRESCIRHPRLAYEVSARRVQGQKLLEAEFRRRDPKTGSYDMVAFAKEAELLVDMAHKRIHVRMKQSYTKDLKGNIDSVFEDKIWTVELPEDLGVQGKTRPSDMTWAELFENRDKALEDRDKVVADIAAHQQAVTLDLAGPTFPEHIRFRIEERKHIENVISGIDAELYQRPAFAMGCLCFVLVGCPVGIWFSKSDYLSAFITCFLPVVIIYYPLMLCGINMARSGKIIPAISIGGADVLMAAAAVIMYRRLTRN